MPRFQLLRSHNQVWLLTVALALAISIGATSQLMGRFLGLYEQVGLWFALGLILVLAVKLFLRWMFAVSDSVATESRAIKYSFRAHLPVRATIWWRYKGVDTLLAPQLEWDGERFETRPKENFVRWAKRNRWHAASLLLSDERALEAAHGVELYVNLWIPLVRKLKWSGELQFDTLNLTPVVEPIPLSSDVGPSEDDDGTPEHEFGKIPTPPPTFARQIVQGTSTERDLVSIATEFINSEFPDRTLLRQRLAERGLSLDFYSPARVQDSANFMFTRYWFKPDAQAGGWLWAENDASFIALPFDRSQLTAETMRHYLSSLYKGLGSGFDRHTHLQIESACRLVRGREPDEYVIATTGRFAGASVSNTDVVPSPPRITNDGRDESRRERERDAVIKKLQSSFNSLESRFDRLAQGGKPNDGNRRQIEAIHDELRDLKSSMERELKGFRARLGSMEEDLASLKAARTRDRAPIAALEDTPRVQSKTDQHRHLAFGADRSAGSSDVMPAPDLPQWIPPSEPAKLSSPSVPAGWKPFVAEEGIRATADDYLEPLQRAFKRLGRRHSGMAKIVHLVESGDHGVYAVHTDDRLEIENGQLVTRCAEKPGFLTPSKQFFLALAEPGQESLWILCPPGTYSSLGFDYPTLIDNVPASSFTIASIVTPARLDRRDTTLYRIATRMNVTFA